MDLKIIEVLVGHQSVKLEAPTPQGHTHRWTLFVRPANKEVHFADNKFVSKVKFTIHESFPTPIRSVKEPPFQVSETGYASFSSKISVYLNLPGQKSHTIYYDLNLSLNDNGYHDQLQKLNIKAEIPPFFSSLIKKYCAKKKSKLKAVSNKEDEPAEKKPTVETHRTSKTSKTSSREKKSSKPAKEKEKGKEREKSDKKSKEAKEKEPKEPSGSKPDQSRKHSKVAPSKSHATKSSIASSPASSSRSTPDKDFTAELAKKIMNITEPDAVFKIGQILLKHPSTKLHHSNLLLSFDLSNFPMPTQMELSNILSSIV